MAYFFPCTKDCPDRKPGCHDHCERYLKKRAELDQRKAKEQVDKNLKHYICQNSGKSMDAAAKRKKSRIGIRRPSG